MSYNLTNKNCNVNMSQACVEDSNTGYESDFSFNGNVDGWTYYNGIHTYGCWNNYLFGTVYEESAVIGRDTTFLPVEAKYFYTVKITMKLVFEDRVTNDVVPDRAKILWRTVNNTIWNSDKEFEFNVYDDQKWHTYILNLAEEQWWQGDINDLRIYPILNNGKHGDQFFIKSIEIVSKDTYKCLRTGCSYYNKFTHNCPGIGERGYCKSTKLNKFVSQGTTFGFVEESLYNIKKGINDELIININGYGDENIKLSSKNNLSGFELSSLIEREITKIDVGGYSECSVNFTDEGSFIIYSGTYSHDSTVIVRDTKLARELNFFDYNGNNISISNSGRQPASLFEPISSFKIKQFQIDKLIDSSDDTEFYFNPNIYSVEGGRQDWLSFGIGDTSKDVRSSTDAQGGVVSRTYEVMDNFNSTIIDFNHPFNASGRISKIFAGVTLDAVGSSRGAADKNRKETQLFGAKIMFFRPRKDGTLRTLPFSVDIKNRDHDSGNLYSASQEYVSLDCDIFVNKGDLIGVYNANIYKSMSITGAEVDAMYYKINYEPDYNEILNVGTPKGQGSAGLLLYARSKQKQKKVILDIEFENRLNIEDVIIKGRNIDDKLEYNVASCLDINWEVDLFDQRHTIGYIYSYKPRIDFFYNMENIAYGVNCLSDGIKVVPDGLSADSFSVNIGNSYDTKGEAQLKKDGGSGVILNNPKYFSVNGDCEWLGVYLLGGLSSYSCNDYEDDPIAFTLKFPLNLDKYIHKSSIYFKEKYNFRNFALSLYKGTHYSAGNADDPRFELLSDRSDYKTPWKSITLDGLKYEPENERLWSYVDKYLAKNPCKGTIAASSLGVSGWSYDELLGEDTFLESLVITNMEQYTQSVSIDWNIITHEWEPVKAKGFRLYCDHHESTKICEFELYSSVSEEVYSLSSSVDVMYSSYGDFWWTGNNYSSDEGTKVFIGDTPKYLRVTIAPITEMYLSNIGIKVNSNDVYMGDKGCKTLFLPEETKKGININNAPKLINFKNVYGDPYDLYVDIESNTLSSKNTVFYSLLNNKESIESPVIGSDAYYRKESDYKLLNYNHNVAINCPVYKLKNLAHETTCWYSHNDEVTWKKFGEIDEAVNINFTNLKDSTITTLKIPVVTRSKWWKIGFLDGRVSTKVRELKVYFEDKEITNAKFYHSKNQDAYSYGNYNTAPHLQNDIIDGSYYVLKENQYIGIELEDIGTIDKIVLYHDSLSLYQNSHNIAGIDISTSLCVRGHGNNFEIGAIEDYSYYEHDLEVIGSGIYCYSGNQPVNYEFSEDFSNCDLPDDWYHAYYTYNDIPSSFTCISGVCPTVSGGYAMEYNMWSAERSSAGTWKKPNIYYPQIRPLDNKYEFNLRFVLKPESFLYGGSSSTDYSGPAVGVLGFHTQYYRPWYGWTWSNYFTGAQIVVTGDGVKIAVKTEYNDSDVSSKVYFNTKSSPYYYELYSDGKGNYHANVWSDGFDGSNKVADIDLYSNLEWQADKVGFGSSYGHQINTTPTLCKGWVGDFRFNCNKIESNNKFSNSSINFNGNSDSYIKVNYDNSDSCNILRDGLFLDTKRFTLDFWIKFKSLPMNIGDTIIVAGSWDPRQDLFGQIIYPSSWIMYIERTSGNFYWKFKVNNNNQVVTLMSCPFYPDLNRWYHIYVGRHPNNYYISYGFFTINGYSKLINTYYSSWGVEIKMSNADIIIGKNLDGYIDELRLSSDYDNNRVDSTYTTTGSNFDVKVKSVPNQYQRYYTFTLFDSIDNTSYGKTFDSDVIFDNNKSYYIDGSSWSQGYYSYFAVDLKQRHDVDIIRSFPVDTSYQFSKLSNVLYSNIDSSDPIEALTFLDHEITINTDFSGMDYDYPTNWVNSDSINAESYIVDNKFCQKVFPDNDYTYSLSKSKFYLKGDFDINADYEIDVNDLIDVNMWSVVFRVYDINNNNNAFSIERSYRSGTNRYDIFIKDNSSSWVSIKTIITNDITKTLRIQRRSNIFRAYFKNITEQQEDYELVSYYEMESFGIETTVNFKLYSNDNYPVMKVCWTNFNLISGNYLFSTYNDTRWLKIKLYNGDGVSRTIKRLGVYPDVTTKITADGKNNCFWESIGTSVTTYGENNNIAFSSDVMGSSYTGEMTFDRLTNGIISPEISNDCWGSSNETNPYVIIILPDIVQIYRIKIYHGYSDTDSDNMVHDYDIKVSDDGEFYSTIFSITGNDAFLRIHDLFYPVSAKYIKIEINNYSALSRFVWTGTDSGFQYWRGAVIREVEVYEYYGYSIINSEESPIIAIDLNQNYYIEDHELTGINYEDKTIDWSNDDSNFTYSNSRLNNPEKVSFREWGSTPEYDRWVLIKRNTATHYPTVPNSGALQTDNPDYLKHVIIKATKDLSKVAPNPIEFPWMWKSNISTLSSDYLKLSPTNVVERSLKISYPKSSVIDHVYFIEGDDFNIDVDCSWRDGLGLGLYINNINNIDLTYGYIYFGGLDYTEKSNPIIHKWHFSSLSDSLNTGWNQLHLSFKYSDELEYTELDTASSGRDTRRLHTIKWGKFGIIFRGNDAGDLQLNIDGLYIRRNHFEHVCFKDYGLYLHGNDFLKSSIGNLSMSSGSIEFWIRPNWSSDGLDIYSDFFNRTLFHLSNVANDVFGAMISSNGIEIYYGNLLYDFNSFNIPLPTINTLDSIMHMAFVFSNNGTSISSDNSTIRFYLNNVLISKSTNKWEVIDEKHFNFILGGQGLLSQKSKMVDVTSSSLDAVIGRLKIHNYCKTDYSDYMYDVDEEVIEEIQTASKFIEISKDNLTFVKVGSDQLPFEFKQVETEDIVPIWVRVNLPKDLSGIEDRTAKIIGSWDIGV